MVGRAPVIGGHRLSRRPVPDNFVANVRQGKMQKVDEKGTLLTQFSGPALSN